MRAKTASATARPSRDEGLAYIAALRAAGVTVVDRHELLREQFARH
jgi:hypothetical protein